MTPKRTSFIRENSDSVSGPCDAATIPLSRIGEKKIVAYLGCAWGLHSPIDVLEKRQFQGEDVQAWVTSLGYALADQGGI